MDYDEYWVELSNSKIPLFSIPHVLKEKIKLGLKLTSDEIQNIILNLDELDDLIDKIRQDEGYYPDTVMWLIEWVRESKEVLPLIKDRELKNEYQKVLRKLINYLKDIHQLPYGLDLTSAKNEENKNFEATILSAVESLTTQLRAKPKGEIHTLSEAKDAVDRAAEKLLLGYHLEQILGLRAYKRYLEAKVK